MIEAPPKGATTEYHHIVCLFQHILSAEEGVDTSIQTLQY